MQPIVFLGDVFLPSSFQSLFGKLGPYCINLEAPITNSLSGFPGKINLKVEQNYLKDTFGGDPLAVCLANNHILDYGPQGLEDTLADLSVRNIPWYGAGTLTQNCSNPLLINHDRITCAFLGYVCKSCSPVFATDDRPGVRAPDLETIDSDIKAARASGAERIIISLHWGAEGVSLPRLEDIYLARGIIDLGADFIIGHHSHCIQPWETYQGKHIFYGLGNCIFPEADVPQLFENGVPKSVRKLRQFRWNRHSLAVAYHPLSGEVSIARTVFNGNTLRRQRKTSIPKLKFADPSSYRRRYHRAFVYGKYRVAVGTFLTNPRIPSLKAILNLISLTKTSQYK